MTESQCECMDGPNYVDPECLYCGGTGVYASDERLAQLIEHYSYLVKNSDGISRRDFKASDQQHLSIFKALQIARADETARVAASILKGVAGLGERIARAIADDQGDPYAEYKSEFDRYGRVASRVADADVRHWREECGKLHSHKQQMLGVLRRVVEVLDDGIFDELAADKVREEARTLVARFAQR